MVRWQFLPKMYFIAFELVFLLQVQPFSAAKTIDFDAFNRDFKNIQLRIVDVLAPCGCVTRSPLEDLKAHVKPADPADHTILHVSEQLLFLLMQNLLTNCNCSQGNKIVEEAMQSTTVGESQEPISHIELQMMSTRLDNVATLVFDACCNPRLSLRVFTFVSGLFTYDEAAQDAQLRGGSLAIVRTRQDGVNAVRAVSKQTSPLIREHDHDGMYAWIGLRRGASSGLWTWQDDVGVDSFSNWGYGEPENADGTVSQCAGLSLMYYWLGGTIGQWNALSCSIRLPYLLETKRVQSPPQEKTNLRGVSILIGVLLGLFFVASAFIIFKKIMSSQCRDGSQEAHPRRRRLASLPGRRRTVARDGDEQEMTSIVPSGAQHHPAPTQQDAHRSAARTVNQQQHRRGHGRGSQYGTTAPTQHESTAVHSPQGGGTTPRLRRTSEQASAEAEDERRRTTQASTEQKPARPPVQHSPYPLVPQTPPPRQMSQAYIVQIGSRRLLVTAEQRDALRRAAMARREKLEAAAAHQRSHQSPLSRPPVDAGAKTPMFDADAASQHSFETPLHISEVVFAEEGVVTLGDGEVFPQQLSRNPSNLSASSFAGTPMKELGAIAVVAQAQPSHVTASASALPVPQTPEASTLSSCSNMPPQLLSGSVLRKAPDGHHHVDPTGLSFLDALPPAALKSPKLQPSSKSSHKASSGTNVDVDL